MLVKRTVQSLKFLQEHLAKRIVVMSTIGEKCGRRKLENSMRVLVNKIQEHFQDVPV